MEQNDLTITKQGKPIGGEPKPGVYYTIRIPAGTDAKALRKELAAKWPKSFFNLRFAVPAPAPKAEPQPKPKDAKPTQA